MAIQPIDLQTLFTQMDKVGKAQVQEKAAITLQQELQTADFQRRAEMKIRSVNKVQDEGEGVEQLKERRRPRGEDNQQEKKEKKEDEADSSDPTGPETIRDPDLGRNVDLSG